MTTNWVLVRSVFRWSPRNRRGSQQKNSVRLGRRNWFIYKILFKRRNLPNSSPFTNNNRSPSGSLIVKTVSNRFPSHWCQQRILLLLLLLVVHSWWPWRSSSEQGNCVLRTADGWMKRPCNEEHASICEREIKAVPIPLTIRCGQSTTTIGTTTTTTTMMKPSVRRSGVTPFVGPPREKILPSTPSSREKTRTSLIDQSTNSSLSSHLIESSVRLDILAAILGGVAIAIFAMNVVACYICRRYNDWIHLWTSLHCWFLLDEHKRHRKAKLRMNRKHHWRTKNSNEVWCNISITNKWTRSPRHRQHRHHRNNLKRSRTRRRRATSIFFSSRLIPHNPTFEQHTARWWAAQIRWTIMFTRRFPRRTARIHCAVCRVRLNPFFPRIRILYARIFLERMFFIILLEPRMTSPTRMLFSSLPAVIIRLSDHTYYQKLPNRFMRAQRVSCRRRNWSSF